MKKIHARCCAAIAAIAMSLALAACAGQKPTLEEWYADNRAAYQDIMDATNAQYDVHKTMLDIHVIDDNVLAYDYTLSDDFNITDEDELSRLKSSYDDMFESYSANFAESYGTIVNSVRTKDVAIRLRVLSSDGKEIYSRDYTEES